MARLSGWKRIGIIASVVWILGAGIFTYRAVEKSEWETYSAQSDLLWGKAVGEAHDKYLSELSHERSDKPSPRFVPDLVVCDDCTLLEEQYFTNHRRVALRVSALVSFTTVALAWGLAYLILFLVNWVKRGFISPGNSN
jgi:hypothetical protein